MRSTAEVLDHQLKCFADRDLDGVLADYSADALFFGPEGALRGPNAIITVFERMFAEFAKLGASVARKRRLNEGEYAYIVWTSETADNSYEFAVPLLFRTEAFDCKLSRRRSNLSTCYTKHRSTGTDETVFTGLLVLIAAVTGGICCAEV